MNKKGFTLIEMLIVIAIIGILSAAVLAGLGPSRNKAKDARIISGMNQIRTIAESVYNPSSATPYKNLTLNEAFQKAKTDIESQGTALNTDIEVSDGAFYIAYVKMLATDGYYCIDSTGFAGTAKANPPSSAAACDGSAWPTSGGGSTGN